MTEKDLKQYRQQKRIISIIWLSAIIVFTIIIIGITIRFKLGYEYFSTNWIATFLDISILMTATHIITFQIAVRVRMYDKYDDYCEASQDQIESKINELVMLRNRLAAERKTNELMIMEFRSVEEVKKEVKK